VQRAYRLNDSLPDEPGSGARWQCQCGGWLLVDRITGRVTAIPLPEFDTHDSNASWYRDYIAYCGFSDDGKKLSTIVVQLGRRKPVLKKPPGETGEDTSDSQMFSTRMAEATGASNVCTYKWTESDVRPAGTRGRFG